MDTQNPYQSPRQLSQARYAPNQPVRRLLWYLAGGAVGAVIGCAASIATVLAIGVTVDVGPMQYEIPLRISVVLGSVAAILPGMIGVAIGLADGPAAQSVRVLAATVLGGLCSGTLYATIVMPIARLPLTVTFWVGVVPLIAGLAAGAVGGLMGVRTRSS